MGWGQKKKAGEPGEKPKNTLRRRFWKAAKWGIRLSVYSTLLLAGTAITAAQYPEQTINAVNGVFRGSMLRGLNKMPEHSVDATYRQLMAQNRYTLIGDTNHSDWGVRSYFFGDENVNNMAAAGVKHVFIEFPANAQYLVEDLAAGKITKEDFIKGATDEVAPLWWTDQQTHDFYAQVADMVMNLNQHGIKFYFIDTGLKNSMGPEEQQFFYDLAESLLDYMAENNPDVKTMSSKELMAHTFITVTTRSFFDPSFREKMVRVHENMMKERLGTDNVIIADQIREKSNGEKSVILYGMAHVLRDNDLDELLGPDNTVTINLYGSRDTYADFILQYAQKKALLTQEPSYVHIAGDNTVYKVNQQQTAPRPVQLAPGMS